MVAAAGWSTIITRKQLSCQKYPFDAAPTQSSLSTKPAPETILRPAPRNGCHLLEEIAAALRCHQHSTCLSRLVPLSRPSIAPSCKESRHHRTRSSDTYRCDERRRNGSSVSCLFLARHGTSPSD